MSDPEIEQLARNLRDRADELEAIALELRHQAEKLEPSDGPPR